MQIYANLIGTWTLLDMDEDNINGASLLTFIDEIYLKHEQYQKHPTVCVTHKSVKYVIPISYIQITDY